MQHPFSFPYYLLHSIVFQHFLSSNFNLLRNIRKIHYSGKGKFIRLNVVRESTTLTMLLVSLKKNNFQFSGFKLCFTHTHTYVCVCMYSFLLHAHFLIINLSSETWKIIQLAEIFLRRTVMTAPWMVLTHHPEQ